MNDLNATATTILNANFYCVLATVCDDGAPWAVPIHFAYDSTYIYWLSHETTIHSRNIERDGRAFITVYDSHQGPESPDRRGAVYISTVAQQLSGDEAMAARDIYADRYPDEDGRKLAEWSIYRAPIGEINQEKSVGQMVYYRYKKEAGV